MKQRYLIVHDYGMGGIWGYMYANSADEIERRYPELKVVHDAPDWLQGSYRTQIEKRTFDIDDTPTGLLLDIINARQVQKKP